jgi:hypothetical protein
MRTTGFPRRTYGSCSLLAEVRNQVLRAAPATGLYLGDVSRGARDTSPRQQLPSRGAGTD